MSTKKKAAIDIINALQRENKLDYADYSTIFDAINEFDTLTERDEELEALWEQLADVPANPDTEKLEEPYLHFPVGTDKEDIWRWFDKRHSQGVAYLLYRNSKTDWFDEISERLRDCIGGDVWSDGDEILCRTESAADALADMFEQMYRSSGEDVLVNTGYYDPEDDKRSGETDRYTGWWYVYVG